jgi:hypothetical protein
MFVTGEHPPNWPPEVDVGLGRIVAFYHRSSAS